MINPPVGSLLEKTGSLYALCNVVGKRARQLVAGAPQLIDNNAYNEVTIAANEIDQNKVGIDQEDL